MFLFTHKTEVVKGAYVFSVNKISVGVEALNCLFFRKYKLFFLAHEEYILHVIKILGADNKGFLISCM